MEIEAKYAITGEISPSQIGALSLAPYTLRDAGAREHHDTIIDTPDQRLGAQRHTLRLRQAGDEVVVTLKRGGSTSGAIHTRDELEMPVADMTIDPDRWPEEIATAIREIIGEVQLGPLFSVDVLRQTWMILKDQRIVGELAFDQGTISAAGRSAPIYELEVELKEEGEEADLTLLGAMLAEQLPLRPEQRSKSRRGRMLLAGEQVD